MAQISIINYSDILEAKRFDAEYFKPEYLKDEDKINFHKWDFLKNLHYFNARYKQPIYDEMSDIKVINSRHLREDEINYEETRNGNNKLVLFESIMINSTGVGTLGRVNINYLKNIKISVDSHINIIISKNINPYYLTTFLQSKYGQNQINKNISGSSGQIEIYPRDFNKFKIPIPSPQFQLQIEKIVKEAHQKQTLSKQLYKEAENILLEELNLINYKPKNYLTFTTTKKEVEEAKRFDSEYFEPKYKDILEKIENYKSGCDYVGKILIFNNKNFFPKENEYYNYLPLSKVSNSGEIEISNKELGKNLPTRARRLVKIGEIILSSISGSLETSAIISKEHNNFIVSNGFYVFKSNKLNPETLLILFKSKIMLELLQRISKGAILGGYDLKTFEKIKIPLIQKEIQEKIAEKIQESHKLRKESKELLEEAKRKVEEEIEKT